MRGVIWDYPGVIRYSIESDGHDWSFQIYWQNEELQCLEKDSLVPQDVLESQTKPLPVHSDCCPELWSDTLYLRGKERHKDAEVTKRSVSSLGTDYGELVVESIRAWANLPYCRQKAEEWKVRTEYGAYQQEQMGLFE